MFLICNICAPTYDDWQMIKEDSYKRFSLGKWYPGNGGYSTPPYSAKELQKFIETHSHNNNEYPLRLEYEVKQIVINTNK